MSKEAQAFWRELYDIWSYNGCCNIDGAEIQDLATRHGLIKEVRYNPEKHGPNDCDMKSGDRGWLILTEAGESEL